jgi:hypothetical protein
MTVLPKSEIAAIKIDKDSDIIPMTVGLYRFFLASGAAGQDAQALYLHLIFTARLQETQQVRANNVYLGNGLGWGQAKVRSAKSFLVKAGLISYVRGRGEDGRVGEVYIRLRFLQSHLIRSDVTEQDASGEDYKDDLTQDLFSEVQTEESSGADHESTTESKTDLVETTESVYHPVADQTHGFKRQMLKVNNEMLETKKGKEEPPAHSEPHMEIAKAWYSRYQKETCITIAPRVDDYKAAADLYQALGGNLSDLDIAIDVYFSRFREFWFAVAKSTSRLPDDKKRPEWSFKAFCSHYHEIIAAVKLERPTAPADSAFEQEKTHAAPEKCPHCGAQIRRSISMARCRGCGTEWERKESGLWAEIESVA